MADSLVTAQRDVAGELLGREVDLVKQLASSAKLVDELIHDPASWCRELYKQTSERTKAATNWAKFCRDVLTGSKFEKPADVSLLGDEVLRSIILEAHERGSLTLTKTTETIHAQAPKGYFGSRTIDVGGEQ